jgi:PAS domain S-box-containing protein
MPNFRHDIGGRTYALVGVLICLVLILMATAFVLSRNLSTVYWPSISACWALGEKAQQMNAKLSHYVDSRRAADLAEFESKVNAAASLSQLLLEGGRNEEAEYRPVADAEVRLSLMRWRAKLDNLRVEAIEWLDSHPTANVHDSEILLDLPNFAELAEMSEAIEGQLRNLAMARVAWLDYLFGALVLAMLGMGLLVSFVMHKLIRRFIQSEKKFQEIRDKFQVTQFSTDHNASGIFWTDQNAKIVYANLAACQMTGYDAEELNQMTVQDIDSSMPPERYAMLWKTLKETGSVVVPTSILTKNGDRRPVEVFAKYLENNGEEYATVTVRDVTDLELARQNLEASQQQYREVVDSVDVGIALVDSNERFVFCNRKAEEIYGVPHGTLSGRSLAEFMHPAQFLTCRKETKKRTYGEKSEYELEITRPNGETRLIYLCAKPRFLDDDTFVGTFGVFEDITDQRRIAEERAKLEDRLQRAEKMESLGLLAGGVAHDLNNMLGPLVGYPELIIRKLPADSPVINWVRKIEKSAELASDVIQDLLTLARRGRYQMKPTNVNEVLKEYVDSGAFARVIERNPCIAFTLNLNPRIGLIEGSSAHLSKTFMNIIQNALEATESGGSVSVSTSQRHLDHLSTGFEAVEEGEYIAVRVVDTGSGIPPEAISKIFEPYFSKKKMGASGSGLGLAVVYGVVKDHKGYYDVISEVGRGTEFILYFPLTTRQQEVIVPKEESGNLGELRVLVISDDPETRELTISMLQSSGMSVVSVDPEGALQLIRESSFDCSVIDVIRNDGCYVVPLFKAAREVGRNLPFICMADGSHSNDRKQLCPRGSAPIVLKPCKPSVLAESINLTVIRERAAELQKKLTSDVSTAPVQV